MEFNKLLHGFITKKTYNVDQVLIILHALKALNASDKKTFDLGLDLLVEHRMVLIPRQVEVKELFKQTHENDGRLKIILATKAADTLRRKVCAMHFRGQCKWGSRCKYSHEQSMFDEQVESGRWNQLPTQGSSGFLQSRDLQAADRTGQLW